jgi:hypothetical protein
MLAVGPSILLGGNVGTGGGVGVEVGSIQASTEEGEYQAISATPITNRQAANASSSPNDPMSLRAQWVVTPAGDSSRAFGEPEASYIRSSRSASASAWRSLAGGRCLAQRIAAWTRSLLGSNSSARPSRVKLSCREGASQADQSKAVMLSGSVSRATLSWRRASVWSPARTANRPRRRDDRTWSSDFCELVTASPYHRRAMVLPFYHRLS